MCHRVSVRKQHGIDHQRIWVFLHQIRDIPLQFVNREPVPVFLECDDSQQHMVFIEGEQNRHVQRQVGESNGKRLEERLPAGYRENMNHEIREKIRKKNAAE